MADIVLNEEQFELLKKLMIKEGEETDNVEGYSDTVSDKGEAALMKVKDGLDTFYTALQLGQLNENPFGEIYKTYAEPLYQVLSKYLYNSRLYRSTHGA
jgi:hypothetical protein